MEFKTIINYTPRGGNPLLKIKRTVATLKNFDFLNNLILKLHVYINIKVNIFNSTRIIIMCIPPLIRYYMMNFMAFSSFFLIMFNFIKITNYDPIIILISYGLLYYFFNRCQRCNHIVGTTKDGIVFPQTKNNCNKCGANLIKCNITKKNSRRK